jgi:hypothetical protein
LRLLQFVAVILTALALMPSGAHLLELPHKIALTEQQYFVMQSIYRGWSLFGAVIIAAITTNLLLALMLFRRRKTLGSTSWPASFWPGRSPFSLHGPTLPIRRPTTGQLLPPIGKACVRNGNSRTPPMQY